MKLRPEDFEQLKEPIPIDEGFIDRVDEQIRKRQDTALVKNLKTLIFEPFDVEQRALFRSQSFVPI